MPTYTLVNDLYPSSLFILFFVISGLFLVTNPELFHDQTINELSVGLLAFMAIFYSLIGKGDVEKTKEKLLRSRLDAKRPILITTLKQLIKEIKSNNPDYKFMEASSNKLSEISGELSLYQEQTDMQKALYRSTILFLVAIFLLFVSPLGWQYTFGNLLVTTKLLALMSFWAASYYLLKLVAVWTQVMMAGRQLGRE